MKLMPQPMRPDFNRFRFRLLPLVALAMILFAWAVRAETVELSAVQTNALIKGSDDAVYYLSAEGKRYIFPNQRIFNSWYQSFSGVQTLSASALAAYPIGGNVKYRPGTRLLKIVSDPTVYAVAGGGVLHALPSESAANALYGSSWATRVDDLPDAFFFDYSIGDALTGTSHPDGTLFKYSGVNTYYLLLPDTVGTLQARAISSSLLSAWRYDTANALTLSATTFPYPKGSALSTSDVALSYPSQPAAAAPTPTNEPPAPSPATLTLSTGSGLSSASMLAIRNDDSALLYRIVLKGDAAHETTVSQISATLYIDAGGSDKDFNPGLDEDVKLYWPVGQVLRDVRLIDTTSGAVLDSVSVVDGSGKITFHTNALVIAAKEQRSLDIIASVTAGPDNARVSVDIIPAQDVIASSPTASSLAIAPATSLNGAANPSVYVTFKPSGKLQIKSSNVLSNTFLPLGERYTPSKLIFTSTGEPFTINRLDLNTTTDGSTFLVAQNVTLTYQDETGATQTDDVAQINNGRFLFTNLQIFVPKNGTAEVSISVDPSSQIDVYSNSRLQLNFVNNDFYTRAHFSSVTYTDGDFGNSQRLINSTSAGPLIVFRQASLVFGSNPASPQSSVTRYSKTTVLTFNVTGSEQTVSIRRLTFKLETNDLNETGDDNDLYERYADHNPFELIGLYAHDAATKEDRIRIVPSTTTFAIFDKSANVLDTTPAGLQTGIGDYGIFVMDFGSSPISLSAGQTLSFDVDIDTTLVTNDKDSRTVRLRLLGDGKSTSVSEANLLWDDGSHIVATGYLISGLDLSGSTLSVQ